MERGAAESSDVLDRGREAYAEWAWRDAHVALTDADAAKPLAADDLELLATSAYMLGLEDEHAGYLERAHHAHLDAGKPLRAAWCACWIGINLATRGEVGPAGGWFGRAQRLVEREGGDCVEAGYLLLPVIIRHDGAGEDEAAFETAAKAAGIADRHDDADLLALALHAQGRARTRQGRVEEGLSLLDEAMVSVVAGELTPIVTGIVYCSVIEGCQAVYEIRRASEWTAALTRWCEKQPDLVNFTGKCLMHRAELMQLRGDWPEALVEAQRAADRLAEDLSGSRGARGSALALYQQAEVHRLRGSFDEAEAAYREVSLSGGEPQPGLALLRLAQGQADAATAAVRRAVAEATGPLARARLLPAFAEIMLAVGELDEARRACEELGGIAARYNSTLLEATAERVHGAVELAAGDPAAALEQLRRSADSWRELDVPYEGARVRVLVAAACRSLGDEETADLELEAARAVFTELGAAHELESLETLARPSSTEAPGGLTGREVEVLVLVATGKTNRAIADELVISEKTVARHMSNIFAKLGLSSRAAATAFAYEHGLL